MLGGGCPKRRIMAAGHPLWAIYIATKDNASITTRRVVKGKLIPEVVGKFKKGKRVVVLGTAVHNPPHTAITP